MAVATVSVRAPTPHSYSYVPVVQQHLQVPGVASWVPRPTTATLLRAHSVEPGASRCPSPASTGRVSRYPCPASPLVSHRSCYPNAASPSHSYRSLYATADAAGPQGAQAGRYASHSPPPQRPHSGSLQSTCLDPAGMARISRSTGVPSTPSLGSTSSCPRPSVHGFAPSSQATEATAPAMHAKSAGFNTLPPTSLMPTLSASAAGSAKAQVLQPRTARISGEPGHAEVNMQMQLEQIQQTLQGLPNHMRQMLAYDFEQTTRQRLQALERTAELQQKEIQEERDVKDGLRAQLAEVEMRLQESERRRSQQAEGHERTSLDLKMTKCDYHSIMLKTEELELNHKAENDQNESCIQQLTQRCIDLERSEQEQEEKIRVMFGIRTSLEEQASERESELGSRLTAATGAFRRVEGENRALEEELNKVKHAQREGEQETQELRRHCAVLEDQLRDAQEQLQQHEQDQQRAEEDIQQWYQKFIESNKENTVLQKVNRDQKRDIWDLEKQLQQEHNAASIAKPGEFLRLMKANEDESLAADNFRLKKELNKVQCDLELCIRKLAGQANS